MSEITLGELKERVNGMNVEFKGCINNINSEMSRVNDNLKEINLELKNMSSFKISMERLSQAVEYTNKSITDLGEKVKSENEHTNKTIRELSEAISKTNKDFNEYKLENEKYMAREFKSRDEKLAEFKNKDAEKALKQKNYIFGKISDKAVGVLFTLLALGIGAFLYNNQQQNNEQEMKQYEQQIIELNNKIAQMQK